MLKTILFDFDNTLVEDSNAMRYAFMELKAEYRFLRNIPMDELISKFYTADLGKKLLLDDMTPLEDINQERTKVVFEQLGLPLRDDAISEINDKIRKNHMDRIRPIKGAKRLLGLLKKEYTIGIVTNHILEYQMEKIERSNLTEYIDFVTAAYDERSFKPDPEIFTRALESANCQKNEAVMIGDHWKNDVLGALNYGIVPIWVNFKNQPEPEANVAFTIRSYFDSKKTKALIETFYEKGQENLLSSDFIKF